MDNNKIQKNIGIIVMLFYVYMLFDKEVAYDLQS